MVMAEHRWTSRARPSVGGEQLCRIDLEAGCRLGRDIAARERLRDGSVLSQQQPASLMRAALTDVDTDGGEGAS